ncbi:MAG: ABC transporter permease subunit [Treponema sp.]
MHKYLTTACRLLVQTAPLLTAAYAALLSEYAGLLHIGIEGLLLTGAFVGMCTLSLLGETIGFASAVIAVFCAAGIGAMISSGMGYLTFRRKADFYVLGLAVNLLASGIISLVSTYFFGNQAIIPVPQFISAHTAGIQSVHLILLAFVSLLCIYTVRYTKMGLRLRLLSRHSPLLYAAGVNTDAAKFSTLIISGSLAAAAGCLLPLKLGAFVPNQSAGKGWIALVLVFAGGKSVFGVAAAALLFVYLENCIAEAQMGLEHPALLIGLPFFLGLLLIIIEKLAFTYIKPSSIVNLFKNRSFRTSLENS